MLRDMLTRMLIDSAPDRSHTSQGSVAWLQPKIAPEAYLIRLNRPLAREEIAYVCDYFPDSLRGSLDEILGNSNGFNFFLSEFFMHGLQPELLARDERSMLNIPFDIFALNTYGRPDFAPEDVAVIAVSGEGTDALIDGLGAKGEVVSGFFRRSPDVEKIWTNKEQWLMARILGAAARFRQRYPGAMPEGLQEAIMSAETAAFSAKD